MTPANQLAGYISNNLQLNTGFEEDVAIVMARELERPGTVLDVGANLGQTLGSTLKVDPSRSYIGFEPQIAACHFVNRFIRDNRLANAIVLPIGLSLETQMRRFWSVGEADTMASLVGGRDGATETVIATRKGDDVLKELDVNKIALIKVDVEGAELEVLQGLQGTISKFKPPVIFEVLPNYQGHERSPVSKTVSERRTETATDIMSFFQSLEYKVSHILSDGSEHPIDAFELDDPLNFKGTNFIARHKD